MRSSNSFYFIFPLHYYATLFIYSSLFKIYMYICIYYYYNILLDIINNITVLYHFIIYTHTHTHTHTVYFLPSHVNILCYQCLFIVCNVLVILLYILQVYNMSIYCLYMYIARFCFFNLLKQLTLLPRSASASIYILTCVYSECFAKYRIHHISRLFNYC